MTTRLTDFPDWTGETVAVLGNAPSLAAELATLQRPIRAIAVNRAAVVAPWADMMVSIDANWPAAADGFQGLRVVGCEGDVDAYFVHLPHEVVALAPDQTIHIRSNLLSAIRIAAQAGATKILLLGIDIERYQSLHDAPGVAEGLAALVVEMAARGVVVERYQVPTSTTAAPDAKAKRKGS